MEEMAGIKQFLIYTNDYVFHIIDHYWFKVYRCAELVIFKVTY